jgi:RNA polymerase-binding transcription factor DksA
MNGLLVQPISLQQSTMPLKSDGLIWNSLQDLKEQISEAILAEGPLCQNQAQDSSIGDACTGNDREIGWMHRSQLEQRLLAITDAQDRLFTGTYGRCTDCGKKISPKRLAGDPAVSFCFDCQRISDGDHLSNDLAKRPC